MLELGNHTEDWFAQWEIYRSKKEMSVPGTINIIESYQCVELIDMITTLLRLFSRFQMSKALISVEYTARTRNSDCLFFLLFFIFISDIIFRGYPGLSHKVV